MTISSSSHLTPDEVARRTFATARRGFAPGEVRAYLESISQVLRDAAERESEVRRQLSEAQHRAANPVLDEETLTGALGHETARVLHTAHEASNEMVAKAEAASEQMLAAAREEVAQGEARIEAEDAERRRRADEEATEALDVARAEGEGMIAQARAECRQMVEEAQALRARVLADLSKRRKVLRAQIEQLRVGRERLSETVHDVRRSIDTIADDLFRAEDDARLAAEAAGRQAVARPDEGTPEEEAGVLLAEEAQAAGEAQAVDELVELVTGEVFDVDAGSELSGFEAEEIVEIVEVVQVTMIGATLAGDHLVEEGSAGAGEPAPSAAVDALFAKIRAARNEPSSNKNDDDDEHAVEDAASASGDSDHEAIPDEAAPDGAGNAGTSPDGPPAGQSPVVVRRDELIAPITTALSRRMKRTLQDDQNQLLDRLRSSGSRWSVDMLPADPEHHDSYATAALPYLEEAAQAGGAFVGSDGAGGPPIDDLLGVAHDLAEAVVGVLRRRLSDDEQVQSADESAVAEHVGAAFREWKGERVERLAGDYVVAAFSAGSLAGVSSADTQVEWVAVSASGAEPCPDCEDNALNGPQPPGDEFPTGHVHPPVHPGCRCLLAPTDT